MQPNGISTIKHCFFFKHTGNQLHDQCVEANTVSIIELNNFEERFTVYKRVTKYRKKLSGEA